MAAALRTIVIVSLLTLVALPTGWYLGSPWWTLWRVREAARAADADRLSAYVDFNALTRRARSDHLRFWSELLAMYYKSAHPNARYYAARAAEKVQTRGLEITVGFEEVRMWLASIPLDFATLAGIARRRDYRPYIVRRGIDTFEVRDRDASIEYGPVLTFKRHGLGWKLEGMRYGQQ